MIAPGQSLAGHRIVESIDASGSVFRHVLRGVHVTRRERVLMCICDSDGAGGAGRRHAEAVFSAFESLMRFAWAPRVAGPLLAVGDGQWAISFADNVSVPMEELAHNDSWATVDRKRFLTRLAGAVSEFHSTASPHGLLALHRRLTPQMACVAPDSTPILSALAFGRSDGAGRAAGPGPRNGQTEVDLGRIRHLLLRGESEEEGRGETVRSHAHRAQGAEREDADGSHPGPRFADGQEILFGNGSYRVIACLEQEGSLAILKVARLEPGTGEERETLVAKVCSDPGIGKAVLAAHRLVHVRLPPHPSLPAVVEAADSWTEEGFVALLSWVEGSPLEWVRETGRGMPSEKRLIGWLTDACEALAAFHESGLLLGNATPQGMIVTPDGRLALTDFDCVSRRGTPTALPGDGRYCPLLQAKHLATQSDDVHIVAAAFFHAVFGKPPFHPARVHDPARTLDWDVDIRASLPRLAEFLDLATHPDPKQRFRSASDALDSIKQASARSGDREERRVRWLSQLLTAYPGGRHGNVETRGVDTEFAERTLVPTGLEEWLVNAVTSWEKRLVVLCGNAGDGKTALLQHLAREFEAENPASSKRIVETVLRDGLVVRMNLDGSAAAGEDSAGDVLGKFLEPFAQGMPKEDVTGLLAINNGPLQKWIEENRGVPLAGTLQRLASGGKDPASHVSLVNLNHRSLVGDAAKEGGGIREGFLQDLIDALHGGDRAREEWAPCLDCTARNRCDAYRSSRLFGPECLGSEVPKATRERARERLCEALQAVYLRGSTHVTVRDLRGALVYILYGTENCTDRHEGEKPILHYFDRAFSPDSPDRQGGVLAELARLDPALDSHPKIDRRLHDPDPAEDGGEHRGRNRLSRASARRKAYFEWDRERIDGITKDPAALGLAFGQHLAKFRDFPLLPGTMRREVCVSLCEGISRLEALPAMAHSRRGAVPFRIPSRTQAETRFWVEKPLGWFRIVHDDSDRLEGTEWLHRRIELVFGHSENNWVRLPIETELFCHLMDLSDGFWLGDIASDDLFARLRIFVQRIVQSDERSVFAWNPAVGNDVHRITIGRDSPGSGRQLIAIRAAGEGG